MSVPVSSRSGMLPDSLQTAPGLARRARPSPTSCRLTDWSLGEDRSTWSRPSGSFRYTCGGQTKHCSVWLCSNRFCLPQATHHDGQLRRHHHVFEGGDGAAAPGERRHPCVRPERLQAVQTAALDQRVLRRQAGGECHQSGEGGGEEGEGNEAYSNTHTHTHIHSLTYPVASSRCCQSPGSRQVASVRLPRAFPRQRDTRRHPG